MNSATRSSCSASPNSTDTGIEQRVHPTMVPKSSAIGRIDGVLNAVAVDADFVGELILVGPGAGGGCGNGVLGRLRYRGRGAGHGAQRDDGPARRPARPHDRPTQWHTTRNCLQSGYYVRLLSVFDHPGALAGIATRWPNMNISLESIVQRSRAPNADAPDVTKLTNPQPVTLITYETSEQAMKDALALIHSDGHVAEPPHFIRIEQL